MTKLRKHRDYDNDYPSVTTVLGVLRNIPLEWWFKVNTLKFINAASGKGKVIGRNTHEAIENYINTGKAEVATDWPEEVTLALKSFVLFKKENPHIILISSEMALTSEVHKFNGTIDCVGYTDNNPSKIIIVDWKASTAKEELKPSIYDTYRYQVSAYVNLHNHVHPENFIEKAIIVVIAKDKISYNLYEMNYVEIMECFNEVFLPALKIYNYQRKK